MGQSYVSSERYLRNPDVVLREEDEDGALLFNPDTSQVKILNTTGLFIWKLSDGQHDTPALIVAMQKEFEDAPADALVNDIKEFLEEMIQAGFVGTLLPE